MKQDINTLLMDIRRFQRLHKRDDLPAVLAEYVNERYHPKILGKPRKERSPSATSNKIKNVVSSYFGLSWEQIAARNRAREVALPRKVCMYLLVTRTKMSLAAIGRMFERDHTTIIHARDSLKDRIAKDDTLRRQVEFLTSKI